MDRYYVNTAAGSKRRKTLTVDTFHYVSILDTLKTIFESESAWNHLLGGKSSIPGVYNDFADGTVAQNHPVLKTHLNSLQVIGYYDELEICNPLGSSAKKHKLGIVFFTIANLLPKLRSTYKAIFLLAIAKVKIIEQHSIDVILRPFVDDLNILATTGIDVKVNGLSRKLHGGLIAFLADNLASHSIGGFKESMSFARPFCRTCMTDKVMSYSNFVEEDFVV